MRRERFSAGGLLTLLKAQHFDSGIALARRVAIKLARFNQIGATNSDPQVTAGTIGNLVGAFLMQLVGSPSTRPAYGHLWAIGGVPAIYNGGSKATPVFDAWANQDTDVAQLSVDVGTQSVSNGAYGTIFRGTKDDSQALLFLAAIASAASGGGGWYGDGSDGNVTIATPTGAPFSGLGGVKWVTDWDLAAGPFVRNGGVGGYVFDLDLPKYAHLTDIPTGSYLHFLARPLMAQDLTINTNNILVPMGNWVCATGTANGIISTDGDIGFIFDVIFASGPPGSTFPTRGEFARWNAGGLGGTAGSSGGVGVSASPLCPNYEGLAGNVTAGDATKSAGAGGAAGGFGGASGGQGGTPASAAQGQPVRALAQICTLLNQDGAGSPFDGGSSGGGGSGSAAGHGGRGGYGGAPLSARVRHVGTLALNFRGGHGQNGLSSGGSADGGGGGGDPGFDALVSDDPSPAGLTTHNTPGTHGTGSGGGSNGVDAGGSGLVLAMVPVG